MKSEKVDSAGETKTSGKRQTLRDGALVAVINAVLATLGGVYAGTRSVPATIIAAAVAVALTTLFLLLRP